MRGVVLLCLLGLVLPAMAGRNPAQDKLEAFYKGDSQARKKVKIEDMMGVFQVLPPMRHPTETVGLKKGQVRLNLWHPVGALSDTELITQAVRWLIFGRTRYATGARGIFSEFKDVREVLLIFQAVTRPNQKGRRRSKQADKIKPYLAIKLSRRAFQKLNLKALRACVDRGDCRREFKKFFKKAKFDRRYAAQARQAE